MLTRWIENCTAAALILVVAACAPSVKPRFSPLPLPEFPERQDVERVDAHYRQAWQMLLGGEPDRALGEFKNSRSSEGAVYTGFGFVYLVKKNYPLSEKNFKKALLSAPDDPMAQSGLGLLYELSGRHEEAFDRFRSVKRGYPNNPWIEIRYDQLRAALTEKHVKRAEAAKNAGSDEEYLRELEKARYYSPEMTDLALKLAAMLRDMGQPEKAVDAYRQLLQNDPYNPVLLQNLAEIYHEMKAYDNALILYRRLLDLNPSELRVQEKIAEVEKAFDESSWPRELKGIFFKEQLNREDTAALLGLYFPSLFPDPQHLIISDISGSYAFREIIRVCGSGVMKVRPDHRFDRYGLLDRGRSALILDRMIRLLREKGRVVDLQPIADYTPPRDIPPTHRDYQVITGLLGVGLLKLDESMQFRPLDPIHPDEFINALKRIELAIQFEEPEGEELKPAAENLPVE